MPVPELRSVGALLAGWGTACDGPQWGLLLDSRCDRLPEASTLGWSPGSGKVLL